MASVSSLDRDLRKMRLDKYTPAAANEARSWIEGVLGEPLAPGDLLAALKDGVALCKLVNLALPPPGVKFKKSAMPFVQMENISHFLRACKSPPLNLQEHDVFLTVDLFESKDPAQVLQCISAFSRAASLAKPSVFPTAIGARPSGLSPQRTGFSGSLSPTPQTTSGGRPRGLSNSSNTSSAYGRTPALLSASKTGDSGRWSPNKSPSAAPKSPSVTSWSSRANEGVTSPAWNIAQYGYMGGANQNNLNISFGGRRQITSASPAVPSLAEKEKRRKEKEAEEQRQRQRDEDQARRKAQLLADEERARLDEERRWEAETKRQRDEEARRVAEEKRRWEEEERQWKITEENRRREEALAEKRLAEERAKVRSRSNSRLQGQFLSQYQAEHAASTGKDPNQRIKELEEQLERARQREAEYENERQTRLHMKSADTRARARSRSRLRDASGAPSRSDSWARGDDSDGEGLRTTAARVTKSRPLPNPAASLAAPAKVKTHRTGESSPAPPLKAQHTGGSSRPLPDPRAYSSPLSTPSPQVAARTERFPVVSNTPPPPPTYARELGGSTEERDAEDRRRRQQMTPKKGGGGGGGGRASMSLLEREMEMERQRQREWEDAQKESATRSPDGRGVEGIGGGIGGRWDVSQFAGYTGGDSMNKGTQGIGAGRRQIVGPRPLPGTPGPR